LKVFEQFLTESKIDFGKIDKKTITYYKAYLTPPEIEKRQSWRNGGKDSSFPDLKYLIEADDPCPVPRAASIALSARGVGNAHPKTPLKNQRESP
jgi:hypothetical protein